MLLPKLCTNLIWLCDKIAPLTFEGWRETLIKYPNFLYAHIRFAELARQRGMFEYANNSLRAAELLGGSNRTDFMLLAGRLALRSGDFQEAAEKFRTIIARVGATPLVVEELVAALLPTGGETESRDLLKSVPTDALSPEGQAMLNYLNKKVAQNVGQE